MLRVLGLLLASLVMAGVGVAQTLAETKDFITCEVKSSDTQRFQVNDFEFSEDGASFKLVTRALGDFQERVLKVKLEDVDIFVRTLLVKENRESIYYYDLVASPRPNRCELKQNWARLPGPELLLGRTPNGSKLKALERAFAHATQLSTGRAVLFTQRGQP